MKLKKLFASFCLALFLLATAGINAQNVPVTTGPAPIQDYKIVPNQIQSDNGLAVGDRCWTFQAAGGPFQFGKSFLETCTSVTLGAPFAVTFPGALANKGGQIWMMNQSSPFQLYTVDTTTGVFTFVVNATGVPQSNFTGMVWDGTTMYGLSSSLAASQIFTINLVSGVCTPIGAPSAVCVGGISLSGMPTSSLFSVDIVLDNLYKWNKATGVATLVGPLGIDANFGQDACFDWKDGKLYWAYAGNTAPQIQFRSIDTTTGATVNICSYAPQNQMTGIVCAEPPPSAIALCEQFAVFPPVGWTKVIYTGPDAWLGSPASGFGIGTGSTYYDCWNAGTGNRTGFVTPTLITSNPAGDDTLYLDVAYYPLGTGDSLVIVGSTDNGVTYNTTTPIAAMNAVQLQSTASGTRPFLPTAAQWKKLRFNIPGGVNKLNFIGRSGFGDGIFVDSICIYHWPVGTGTQGSLIPVTYSLNQNYPNPFNPSTVISFGLPKSGNVKLVVYDILGREVKTLVNDFQTAGTHNITFDASQFASGIYFYSIKANDFTATKKMLLVK